MAPKRATITATGPGMRLVAGTASGHAVLFDDAEGNSAAHILASLTGSSAMAFVENGKLVLGAWQAIYLCEFDGPRTRTVLIRVLPG